MERANHHHKTIALAVATLLGVSIIVSILCRSAVRSTSSVPYARHIALEQSRDLNSFRLEEIRKAVENQSVTESLMDIAELDTDSKLRQGAILVLFSADRIPDVTWLFECYAYEQSSAVRDTLVAVVGKVEPDLESVIPGDAMSIANRYATTHVSPKESAYLRGHISDEELRAELRDVYIKANDPESRTGARRALYSYNLITSESEP